VSRKILDLFLALILALFLSVMLIEIIAGCGTSYVDAHGTRHYYSCVFVDTIRG